MYKTLLHLLILSFLLLTSIVHATTSLPKIVIIIDDLGDNKNAGLQVIKLPGPVVCSILPHTLYSVMLAETAYHAGKEVILHVPMQAIKPHALGEGGLQENMSEIEFKKILNNDIHAVPYIKGVNNHMGSRLTMLPQPMQWLMQTLKTYNFYFIDSKTTPKSIAEKTARAEGLPTLHRDIFLDDIQTSEAVAAQFNLLLTIARQQGYAIAIGHPHAVTLKFLEKVLPTLSAQGIELVSINQLLKPTTNKTIPEILNDNDLTKTKKLSEFICDISYHFCEWLKLHQ